MFRTKVVETTKHTLMFNKFFLIEIENCTVYEIMWNNTVQPDRQQMTIWRMRTACWISKATKTYSEYVILIDFPLQQWFHESASLLRYSTLSVLLLFELDEDYYNNTVSSNKKNNISGICGLK
jgi:hypothetical protein